MIFFAILTIGFYIGFTLGFAIGSEDDSKPNSEIMESEHLGCYYDKGKLKKL